MEDIEIIKSISGELAKTLKDVRDELHGKIQEDISSTRKHVEEKNEQLTRHIDGEVESVKEISAELAKSLQATKEGLEESIVSTKTEIEARLSEIVSVEPTAANGIKSVQQVEGEKSFDLIFDNDDVATISLPVAEPPSAEAVAEIVAKNIDLTKQVEILRDVAKQLRGTPRWEAGIYRKESFVQHYMGQFFEALEDTTDEPGTSDKWKRIGTDGWRFTGPHNDERVYVEGDLFVRNYGLFGHFNGQDVILAGRGAKGEKGERGVDGRPGIPGANGKDGADIVAVEVDGLKAVIVSSVKGKNGEQELRPFTIDFEKSLETIIANFQNGVLHQVEELTKSVATAYTVNHPTDGTATPLRFYRGNWQASISYDAGDLVLYNGLLFVAEKDAPSGNVPGGLKALTDPFPVDEYWRKVAIGNPSGLGGTSVSNLIRNSNDVDLTSGLTEGAFLKYNQTKDRFDLAYIDTFARAALDLTNPASDNNVPSSLNVQQLVATTTNTLQNEIAAIQTGISHEEGVIDVLNGPPGTVREGDRYIVGPAPTADFAGHANAVAELVAGTWVYNLPDVGDAHYVDNQGYTVIWNGTLWIPLSRQAKVSFQGTAPVNPITGDIWLDNSNAAKMVIKFWTGTAWVTEAGTKTFTVSSDPAAVAANQVKDGDIWVEIPPPPPAPQPAPVTHVRAAGAWTTTTPSIPASSRTYIQNTRPVGAANGDLWINTSQTPPTKQWFWGAVPAGPGGVPPAVAGAWHSDAGTRTFVQDTDPTSAAGGSANPLEGDLWTTVTAPVSTKVWHLDTATNTSSWIATSAAPAVVGLTPLCIGSINTPSSFYRVATYGGGGRGTYFIVTFTNPLPRIPKIIHASGSDPGTMTSHVRDISTTQFLAFAQVADSHELWPNDITFVIYV